jgi:dihydrofolate reductase
VQSFLREGLVDELTVTTVPVLIGHGRPLFGPLSGDITLDLVESRSWPGGFVLQRWRPRATATVTGTIRSGRDEGRPP